MKTIHVLYKLTTNEDGSTTQQLCYADTCYGRIKKDLEELRLIEKWKPTIRYKLRAIALFTEKDTETPNN